MNKFYNEKWRRTGVLVYKLSKAAGEFSPETLYVEFCMAMLKVFFFPKESFESLPLHVVPLIHPGVAY